MPAGNITLADISSADWSLMLDSSAPVVFPGAGIGNVVQGVADVNQCIGIILATPQGSDPLRPTFACDLWRWMDVPVTVARPALVREIVEAIMKWEPRINLLSVTVDLVTAGQTSLPVPPNSNVDAQLLITIVWQLKIDIVGAGTQRLTLTVPRNLV
jgi:uncharacterized protein